MILHIVQCGLLVFCTISSAFFRISALFSVQFHHSEQQFSLGLSPKRPTDDLAFDHYETSFNFT